ncbi:hypothetical protein [Luteolibacter soli]|uniref:DUF3887 domain-containing protein n=1 Tax=Luteolibacter soli TaxID=3135280 RepID=A0ABU9AN99_9BACT
MKTLLPLLAVAAMSVPVASAKEEPKKPDLFENGLRQVMDDYRKGDDEAVIEKLRVLLKMMEEKGAKKVGDLLPDAIDAWKGETLKQEDLSAFGGGVSMTRMYASGKKEITVKVIKDSPVVKQLIPLIGNEELMKLANRKTYSISGETAVMEGEKKLQLVVDKRILVELTANEVAEEKDLVALARKLDLNALAKMK